MSQRCPGGIFDDVPNNHNPDENHKLAEIGDVTESNIISADISANIVETDNEEQQANPEENNQLRAEIVETDDRDQKIEKEIKQVHATMNVTFELLDRYHSERGNIIDEMYDTLGRSKRNSSYNTLYTSLEPYVHRLDKLYKDSNKEAATFKSQAAKCQQLIMSLGASLCDISQQDIITAQLGYVDFKINDIKTTKEIVEKYLKICSQLSSSSTQNECSTDMMPGCDLPDITKNFCTQIDLTISKLHCDLCDLFYKNYYSFNYDFSYDTYTQMLEMLEIINGLKQKRENIICYVGTLKQGDSGNEACKLTIQCANEISDLLKKVNPIFIKQTGDAHIVSLQRNIDTVINAMNVRLSNLMQ